ncbi:aminoglycoside N(3)-acetyltransferase [Terrilactibacillus laevilacticus]|uniref:aminoglycoside N(3)-acetyltransferase n=1 Tax=Terrilactibacillus laevilacticus TaxID=1380157 RepID=UPI002482BE0A|nr:AAC(3) family N-acetyltransferase [Terrilactibacillus laevilacticus]
MSKSLDQQFSCHTPRTRESLTQDLKKLGIKPGMTIIVHSSLRSIGWVSGGPVTVVQALMDVITPEGTLVMPTHSADYCDPETWTNPPVPENWIQIIRDTMPGFDPNITPTYFMGKIVETFRTFPNVLRSYHPLYSFAAWGKKAKYIIENHSLDNGLGDHSPLAKLYQSDAQVLLLGVGYDNNTSFHLSEYRYGGRKKLKKGSPVLIDGERRWVVYHDIEFDPHDSFSKIGYAFEKSFPSVVKHGKVGSAPTIFFPQKKAVDFAVSWLNQDNHQQSY